MPLEYNKPSNGAPGHSFSERGMEKYPYPFS